MDQDLLDELNRFTGSFAAGYFCSGAINIPDHVPLDANKDVGDNLDVEDDPDVGDDTDVEDDWGVEDDSVVENDLSVLTSRVSTREERKDRRKRGQPLFLIRRVCTYRLRLRALFKISPNISTIPGIVSWSRIANY